jgi:hypothetical protein
MPLVWIPSGMADDGARRDADSATGQTLPCGSFSVQAKARRPRGRRAFLVGGPLRLLQGGPLRPAGINESLKKRVRW